jgi:hypothetical protein
MGARIAAELGIDYQGRSGPVALLHRLGMERRKPGAISHQLAPEKQAAFIKAYDNRRNRLEADEAVLLGNTVSPAHTVRPVGCWAPKDVPGAVEQSSGRDRLNIHGAPDLETGRTVMKDVLTGGCREHDPAADGDRSDVSRQAPDPPLPRQRPIPSREAGAGMAEADGLPDQAALHSGLLPAPQSD